MQKIYPVILLSFLGSSLIAMEDKLKSSTQFQSGKLGSTARGLTSHAGAARHRATFAAPSVQPTMGQTKSEATKISSPQSQWRNTTASILSFKGQGKSQQFMRAALCNSQKLKPEELDALRTLIGNEDDAKKETITMTEETLGAFRLFQATKNVFQATKNAFSDVRKSYRRSERFYTKTVQFESKNEINIRKSMVKRSVNGLNIQELQRLLAKQQVQELESQDAEKLRGIRARRIVFNGDNERERNAQSKYKIVEKAKVDLLHFAEIGNVAELQKIISLNLFDLDTARDALGNTALALASRYNQFDAVRLLLAAGMQVMTYNNNGKTPLELAAETRNLGIKAKGISDIEWRLKRAGATITDNKTHTRIIFELMQQKNLTVETQAQIRKLLIKYSPNMCNERGNSLLAIAVTSGSIEVVKLLVEEFHAYVNATNDNQAILDLAQSQRDIYAYLKKFGALSFEHLKLRDELIKEIQAKKDVTQALTAFANILSKDEIKALLESLDIWGNSALSNAILAENASCIELLCGTYQVQVNSINRDFKTCLDLAVEQGNIAIGGILKKYKACQYYYDRSDTISQMEQQILNHAREGNTEHIQMLLDKNMGVDVNAVRDEAGNSPLALAIMNGHLDTVQYLLSVGADFNAINKELRSIRDIARDLPENSTSDLILAALNDAGALYGDDIYLKNLLFNCAATGRDFIVCEVRQAIPEWVGKDEDRVSFKELLSYLQEKHDEEIRLFGKRLGYSDFLNMTDSKGYTLLTTAVVNEQKEIVQTLLEDFCSTPQNGSKVNINHIDDGSFTPLDRAHKEIRELLEEKNACTFFELTLKFQLLCYASQGNVAAFKKEIAEMRDIGNFKEHKFINEPDAQGQTPLILAAQCGQLDMVKYLLKDLAVSLSRQGQKALEAARARKQKRVVEYIEEKMKTLPTSEIEQAQMSGITKMKTGEKLLSGSAINSSVAQDKFIGSSVGRQGKDKSSSASNSSSKSSKTEVKEQETRALSSTDIDNLLTGALKGHTEELLKLFARHQQQRTLLQLLNDSRDPQKHTAVALATKRSHLKCVQMLIAHGANPNTLNVDGKSPLDHARENLHQEIATALSTPQITAYTGSVIKAVQNARDAVKKGDVDLLRTIIKQQGFPINKMAASLIVSAVQLGQLAIVQCLIEDYSVSHKEQDRQGHLLIEVAVLAGHIPIIEYLLKRMQARHELHDDYIASLALLVIQNKRQEVLEFLINNGYLKETELYRLAIQNQTLLDCAQKEGTPEIVDFLKSKNALTEEAAKLKQAIFEAVMQRNFQEFSRLMGSWTKNGYKGEQLKDRQGNTPVHYAVETDHLPTVKLVTEFKVGGENLYFNIDDHNHLGQTPFDKAREVSGVAQYFRDKKAKKYADLASSKDGQPSGTRESNRVSYAFQYAGNGNIEQLKDLLENGHVSPDLQDANKDSLVAVAAQSGRKDIVVMLVNKFNAKIATLNMQNKSPMHLAASEPHILAFLENKLQSLVVSAIEKGQTLVCVDLVTYVSDINEPLGNKLNYLDHAQRNSKTDIERMLRSKGALTSELVNHRNHLLELAKNKKCDTNEFIRILQQWQKAGGTPELLKDKDGNTPLHNAAAANIFSMVHFLVQLQLGGQQHRYFNTQQQNNKGLTALDVVQNQDLNFEEVRILLAKNMGQL